MFVIYAGGSQEDPEPGTSGCEKNSRFRNDCQCFFAEDIQDSKNAGMNEHIAKPIEIKNLISKIAQYCRNKTVLFTERK